MKQKRRPARSCHEFEVSLSMRRKGLRLLVFLSGTAAVWSCGYKAPPTPLFDADERFAEDIEQSRTREKERAMRDETNPPVVFPQPVNKRSESASRKAGAADPAQKPKQPSNSDGQPQVPQAGQSDEQSHKIAPQDGREKPNPAEGERKP